MSHPETIDRFVIVRQVGAGGMGTVYEAIDPHIDRRVALKVLRRDMLTQNPELIERLWVEARAVNSIHHPGVVQISEARLLADGTGFLVMEFLDGQTLTQRLRQAGGKLPVAQVLQIAVQMASTLNAGHRKGIIHRDLKPDNVMLVSDDAVAGGERIKLLDFGIAKITNAAAASAPLTLNDMGLGTPGYMAPEQMRDAVNASDRSDVYGLAAVVFEILSGRRPHVAPNAAELIVMVLSQDPPLLTSLVPDVPLPLAALLARMLQREPASTRPTMAEVLRELVLIQGAPIAQLSRQSGPVQILEPSPVRRDTVPPTIVRAAAVASDLGRLDALADVPAKEQSASPPLPSASTISQMTGQTGLGAERRKGQHIAQLVGVTALASCLVAGAAWWKLKNSTPPGHAEPPLVASTPNAPSPRQQTLVAAVPRPAPTVKPPRADEPAPNTALAGPALPAPPTVRSILPDSGCIHGHGAGLPQVERLRIAMVFKKAEVRLLPSDRLYLFRQGASLQLDSDTIPSQVGRKQVEDVTRMLRTAISNALPPALKGVYVRCSAK